MGFIKHATTEKILEVKQSSTRLDFAPEEGAMLKKFATKSDEDIEGGYLYVRTRAISSRVNKNNDGWPSEELANAYRTFVGRPIFVDHNNSDPRRARGVIVDAKLHVEDSEKTSALDPYYSSAPDNHKPPTWIELLLEVDARTYPKLAGALKTGDIDATSMGANIVKSICSVCANEATVPSEYCKHIQQKGATFEITADNGEKIRKKAYEDCYGVNFFEDSFVFDPADETALNIGVEDTHQPLAKEAGTDFPAGPGSIVACPMCSQEAHDHGDHIDCPWCGYKALKGDRGLEHSAKESFYGIPQQNFFNWLTGAGIVTAYGVPYAKALAARLANGEPPAEVFQDLDPELRAKIESIIDANNLQNLHPYDQEKQASYGALMTKVAEADVEDRTLNHEPQEEMITAPKKVDTLRDDVECPNCQSDVLQSDPDGIMRCPTCSYEQPPQGLDNPDLTKANDVDKEETLSDDDDKANDVVRATDEDANDKQDFIKPLAPTTSATNYDVPTGVISEMNWETKIATSNAAEANEVLRQLTAATVQTQIEFSGGIHFGTHAAFKAAGITANVTYPGAPGPLPIPGNPMQHFMFQMNAVKEQGLGSPGELTVTVDAPDDQLDEALRLIHNGGNMAHDASTKKQPVKDVLMPQGSQKGDEPKAEKVVSDQLAPVTADRRVIKREESPDGHRTEQIIEETGNLLGDDENDKKKEAPKSEENQDTDDSNEARSQKEREEDKKNETTENQQMAASVEDPQEKFLAALSVAEDAVTMGVIDSNKKLAFVGQLEKESLAQIEARRQTLNLVKSAGLTNRKIVSSRTSRALPRLGSASFIDSGAVNLDDIPFDAVFIP